MFLGGFPLIATWFLFGATIACDQWRNCRQKVFNRGLYVSVGGLRVCVGRLDIL